MPYQNNNNRITPDAAEDRKLKPAASPANKSIKYAVDNSESAKWTNAANALASLGKGIMEMDVLWHYQSQENAIKARAETEMQGGNKNDWAEVSKNIKGAAIFNPYNDDAFRKIQSYDICRQGLLAAVDNPELEKMDEKSYTKLINDTQKKTLEALKSTGLQPKDYGHALMQFHKQLDNLGQKYIIAHKKYQFNQLKVYETSDTSTQIFAALIDAEEGEETAVCRQVLENKIKHLSTETGIVAPDTQAEVIIGGIKNYIARNANQLDDAEILAAISDFKLGNGQLLQEVVPNYDVMIKDLLIQAREADLRQMKLEIEQKDMQEEKKVREVFDDFMGKITKGELSSPEELQKYAKDMYDQQNIEGIYGLELFKKIQTGKLSWNDLGKTETDPLTYKDLWLKMIAGENPRAEIFEALSEGKINTADAQQLYDRLTKEENKQQTANDKRVKDHIKAATEEFLEGYHKGDKDVPALLEGETTLQNMFLKDMEGLEAEYQKTGDYQTFNDKLAKMKSSYRKLIKREQNAQTTGLLKNNYKFLIKTPVISDAQRKMVDLKEDTKAVRKMGLVQNRMGWDDKGIEIESAPEKSRKVTVTNNGKTYTKDTHHDGYDLKGANVYAGRAVYPPMNGTVVAVLHEKYSGGMGNMVGVLCDNGKFIKYMHLQQTGLPYVGQRVSHKNPVGYIGNTGAVEKGVPHSLHMEWYDENNNWITPAQWLNKEEK